MRKLSYESIDNDVIKDIPEKVRSLWNGGEYSGAMEEIASLSDNMSKEFESNCYFLIRDMLSDSFRSLNLFHRHSGVSLNGSQIWHINPLIHRTRPLHIVRIPPESSHVLGIDSVPMDQADIMDLARIVSQKADTVHYFMSFRQQVDSLKERDPLTKNDEEKVAHIMQSMFQDTGHLFDKGLENTQRLFKQEFIAKPHVIDHLNRKMMSLNIVPHIDYVEKIRQRKIQLDSQPVTILKESNGEFIPIDLQDLRYILDGTADQAIDEIDRRAREHRHTKEQD